MNGSSAERMEYKSRRRQASWVPPLQRKDFRRQRSNQEHLPPLLPEAEVASGTQTHHQSPLKGDASPTTDESGVILLSQLHPQGTDEEIEALISEHLYEIILTSNNHVAQLLILELGEDDSEATVSSVNIRMRQCCVDKQEGGSVIPEGSLFDCRCSHQKKLEINQIRMMLVYRDLIFSALEVSQLKLTRENLKRMIEWANELLFHDITVEKEQNVLTQEQVGIIQERVNSSDTLILQATLLRMVLRYFDSYLKKEGMRAISLPEEDIPNISRLNRRRAVLDVLHRLAQSQAEKANEGEEANFLYERIFDENPEIELWLEESQKRVKIRLVDVLTAYIKVSHFKTLLRSQSIPPAYLEALAERAIALVCEGIVLEEEGSDICLEELDGFQRNIMESNDPVMLATRDFVVHKTTRQSK